MVFIPRVTQRDKEMLEKRVAEADDSFPFANGEALDAWVNGQAVSEKGDDQIEEDKDYSHVEMKAFFAAIPVWALDAEIDGVENKAGVDTDPDPSPNPGARRLRHYWTRGKGAAKIRWGVKGDYNRCVTQLSKYVGVRAKGLCNVYHRSATGSAPGKGPHAG